MGNLFKYILISEDNIRALDKSFSMICIVFDTTINFSIPKIFSIAEGLYQLVEGFETVSVRQIRQVIAQKVFRRLLKYLPTTSSSFQHNSGPSAQAVE